MEKHLFFDENNKPIEFIIKAKFTLDDVDYVAMMPSDELDQQIYILKISVDEYGKDVLVGIDDDELEDAVSAYEELIKNNLQ